MEKQVGFDSRVGIMSPGWPIAILPEHIFGNHQIPSSGELEWSPTSLGKLSSAGYSRFGLPRSTHKGTSNYNYGYSTAERPNMPGLLLFSSDDDDSDKGGCNYSAWVHDQQLRCTVACWSCIALLSLVILAVVATVLTWCIIIPRRPYLELIDQGFHVQSLTVSKESLNISSQHGVVGPGQMTARFSANFTLQLLVENPNRVATDYASARFSVAYRDSVLGKATMSAFSQKAHATAQWAVDLRIANVDVSQQNAVSLLIDANADSIPLEVYGRLHARLRILGLSTPPVLIECQCSVEIKVSERKVTSQLCHVLKHKVIW